MILILDCIGKDTDSKRFRYCIGKILDGYEHCFLHMNDITDDFDIASYDRMIISGSELSAAEKNAIDPVLYDIIGKFLDAGKGMLGICYGHQMIIKTIYKGNNVRKATIPEFGFGAVSIEPCPLFKGIKNPIFFHSHFDEVYGLDDRFAIIAASERCGIQGFWLKGSNVWGVQFHPEPDLQTAHLNLSDNLRDYEAVREHCMEKDVEPKLYEQNKKVIENFVSL